MKYLKRFNESIEDIDSICEKYGIINYTVNPDGTVDVDGNVDLSNRKLTRLPLKFGKVSGNFYCSYNKLTTLEGCPTEVGGSFLCNNNQLTTLKGGPKIVGRNFVCYYNKLTTLEGCPKEVVGHFSCSNNKLTIINWDDVYTLNSNSFDLTSNPICEVYKIFRYTKTFIDSLEWNYFKEPNIIIKERFVEACEVLSEETGRTIRIPEKIEGYIFE